MRGGPEVAVGEDEGAAAVVAGARVGVLPVLAALRGAPRSTGLGGRLFLQKAVKPLTHVSIP